MNNFLLYLADLDPGPIFVFSLFPFLFFLYWANKTNEMPKISLWGFRMTLLFVGITIAFSIFAQVNYGKELTDIDALHGSAEAFLAISDGLVALGFAGLIQNSSK